MIKLTDTHAHIHIPPLADDIEGVVVRALNNGVERIVTVGINSADSAEALKTALMFQNVYAAVGIHPEDCESFSETSCAEILRMASHKKVIAVGEIGLDLYRDYAPIHIQEEVFRRMLEVSKEVKKPVIIHNREASTECLAVLNEELGGGKSLGGIFHCFSGGEDIIKWALDNNFYISYAGQLTYKSAGNLRETLKYIPINRIFVETDSPYLAPVPFRGKVNEPANVLWTATFAAKELGIEIEELAERLEENFNNLFGHLL